MDDSLSIPLRAFKRKCYKLRAGWPKAGTSHVLNTIPPDMAADLHVSWSESQKVVTNQKLKIKFCVYVFCVFMLNLQLKKSHSDHIDHNEDHVVEYLKKTMPPTPLT